MTLGFSAHTSSTRLAILLNEVVHTRPSILTLDKTNSLILTRVSSEYMVMLMVEDLETEVRGVGNVDTSIVEKITCIVNQPVGIQILQEGKISRVSWKSGEDVRVELFCIHDDSGFQSRGEEFCCAEGSRQLFLAEDRAEVVWIDR